MTQVNNLTFPVINQDLQKKVSLKHANKTHRPTTSDFHDVNDQKQNLLFYWPMQQIRPASMYQRIA